MLRVPVGILWLITFPSIIVSKVSFIASEDCAVEGAHEGWVDSICGMQFSSGSKKLSFCLIPFTRVLTI